MTNTFNNSSSNYSAGIGGGSVGQIAGGTNLFESSALQYEKAQFPPSQENTFTEEQDNDKDKDKFLGQLLF